MKNLRKKIKALFRDYSVFIAFVLLFIFASIQYDNFLTVLNMKNLLRQYSIIGLVAVGMTFVIITGGIDLSVGSVLALSGVIAAVLSKYNIVLALIAALACGALIGAINGLIIIRMRIVPFIATLAMMMGIRGITYIITNESTIPMDDRMVFLGRSYLGGIPAPAVIFVIILLVAAYIARYLSFGRHIYAVGGNEEAAKMMGLNINRVKMGTYTICGILSALAGVILASRLGAGQAVAGDGYELKVIASVAVGGTLLTGGIGKIFGTFFGIFIMGIIIQIFNMQSNLNSWWQNVLLGLLVMIVVMIQSPTVKEFWKVNALFRKGKNKSLT